MTTRKIIVVPCIVKSWLNVSGDEQREFGTASWRRMSSASTPPTTKKKSAVTR